MRAHVFGRDAVALVRDLDHDDRRLSGAPSPSTAAPRRRMTDRIRDEVVERLPQPLGVAVDVEARLDLGDDAVACERRRLDGVRTRSGRRRGARAAATRGQVGEQPVDACDGGRGELEQPLPRRDRPQPGTPRRWRRAPPPGSAARGRAPAGGRRSPATSRDARSRAQPAASAEHRVVTRPPTLRRAATHRRESGVADREERVASQPARIVPRHVQAVELGHEVGHRRG